MKKTTSIGDIWQGDVRLVPIHAQPAEGAPTVRSLTLARGEITGHDHVLEAEAGIVVWDDMVWVLGEEPGILSHPDHDPKPAAVVLPGQAYRVVVQREMTLSGQWAQVKD